MALSCTANQVDNLFSSPIITWMDQNGIPLPSEEGSNPRMDPETGQLLFDNITSGNSGTYTCQSVVNIPQAQIVNHIDMDTVNVNTIRE